MKNKFTACRTRGEMTLLAAAVCAALRATAATDASDVTLEPVTVTAERRSESIQEVPLSVTAISGDTLQKFNAVDFTDYAHSIPNLSFGTGSDFGVTNGRTITIRGITGGRYRNGGATTSFYIDDTPLPTALDPRVLDLERVEVLRGPQGTLFGSSAMGGTVRLITKTAEAQSVSGFVDVQGFDIDDGGAGYDISGTVNLPLVTDQLGLKFSAYNSYKPGWFTRAYGIVTTPGYTIPAPAAVGEDKHIASDTQAGGMLTLAFTPSALPGLSVTPMVIYQSDRGNGFPLADYSPDNLVQERPLNVEESYLDEWVFSSLTAKYKMDFGSVIASSAWFHRETHDDEDNTEVSATFWGPTYATGLLPAAYLASPAPSYLNSDSVTQEIRFESSFDAPIQAIAGLYYDHGKSHTGQDITTPVLVGQPLYTYYPYIQDVPLSNNEVAEFGDLTYTVAGLELSAGVRGSTLEYSKLNYWYGWINGGLEDARSATASTPSRRATPPNIKSIPTLWCMPARRRAFAAAAPTVFPTNAARARGSSKATPCGAMK
jgi:iron complex outermembrane receptor protein